MKKEDDEPEDLRLLPNGDGTYRVENMSIIEPYQGNSEPKFPEVVHVPTQISIFDADLNRDTCPDDIPCRSVRRDNKDDMLWYLTKVYQDVNAKSVDFFNDLMKGLATLDLLSENPLSYTTDGQNEIIVGQAGDLAMQYMQILLLYKKLGRSLPKPDPTVDYSL